MKFIFELARPFFVVAAGMLVATLTMGPAYADIFTFSYTVGPNSIFGGTFYGTLAADGNTFTVDGYKEITIDGAPAHNFTPEYFGSIAAPWLDLLPEPDGDVVSTNAVLTLDGSFMDINVSQFDGIGFQLLVDHYQADFDRVDIYGEFAGPYGKDFGGSVTGIVDAPFDNRYNAFVTVTNTVSEPVTLSLFGAGLAGATAMRRRKKATKA